MELMVGTDGEYFCADLESVMQVVGRENDGRSVRYFGSVTNSILRGVLGVWISLTDVS